MKFIINDEIRGDIFTSEFDTAAEAVSVARAEWEQLSEHDKKQRTAFFVLESVNPDEDAENHFDGNIIWEAK